VVADADQEKISQLTERFKIRISDPLDVINPDLEMGQYFVIPIKEIREMLDSHPDIEFVHVCNALRETTNSENDKKVFPVVVLVPLAKNNAPVPFYEVCNTANTVFVEAYPCPPDPRCPKPTAVTVPVFKPNTQFNDFKSLI
jgi:hypothetical protein